MGNSSGRSTKGDLFDQNMIFILVGAISLLGKAWLDVFIVSVNCRDWMKKKRLSTTDRILTLQGSIRLSLECMNMIWSVLLKFYFWVTQVDYVTNATVFIFQYLIACNVWLTASLCSYYCVKIAEFSHPFFIHLKQRLSGLGMTWLLGSAILALPTSLPFLCSRLKVHSNRNFSDFSSDKNVTDISHSLMVLHTSVLLGLGYFAALIFCATSALLLLFSLWRHHQRMLSSWDGHGSPRTNAHFQAVITILSLLINNIVIFICIQLVLRVYEEISISYIIGSVALYSCFSIETLISVWGNKKLKNELRSRSFCFAKCRRCVS